MGDGKRCGEKKVEQTEEKTEKQWKEKQSFVKI